MIRTIILALLWGLMLLGLMYGAIMEAENNAIYEKHHGGQYDYR
jgi:hypothetical protein